MRTIAFINNFYIFAPQNGNETHMETTWDKTKKWLKDFVNIDKHIDTADATEKIKSNIWFRGPNVWILAFSIIIASVGLNVNSTAVIIGAMLVSPLMGPIVGIGLALGINDIQLLKDATKNLLIMVAISLAASCIFFFISPLNLVNPTELEARTTPTIYDVLIALFGGLAGILESCRKEKGTVLSGVAIATALMPPLCTAGFGLANGSWHFFGGAMFLFLINTIFITLATYMMVKYLRFESATEVDDKTAKRKRTLITIIMIAVIVPSIWSAVKLIRDNNFNIKARNFMENNRFVGSNYIYDYTINTDNGHTVEIILAGDSLTADQRKEVTEAAQIYGLKPEEIVISNRDIGQQRDKESERIIKSIYEMTDTEMARRDKEIEELKETIFQMKTSEIPYDQLAKELRYHHPEIEKIYIGKGAAVSDSISTDSQIIVLVNSKAEISQANLGSITEWLKIRLDNDNVIVVER